MVVWHTWAHLPMDTVAPTFGGFERQTYDRHPIPLLDVLVDFAFTYCDNRFFLETLW